MSIDAKTKAKIIKENAREEGDTGSPEVQVAILTQRIRNLTDHFNVGGMDPSFRWDDELRAKAAIRQFSLGA